MRKWKATIWWTEKNEAEIEVESEEQPTFEELHNIAISDGCYSYVGLDDGDIIEIDEIKDDDEK